MYRYLHKSNIPKWLKIIFYILLSITLIYWIIWLIYKGLEYTRKFLHWTTEPRNWWTFLVSILLVLVGSFLMAQFVLGLDPIGKLTKYITEIWGNIINNIGNTT